MKKTRLFMLVGILLLSLAIVGMAMAADSNQDKNPPNKATDSSTPNEATPLALWPGPDGFGYSGQVVNQNWVDITASGTPITGLGDDNSAGPFPLGFTFNFYGIPWTDFYANSNGFLTFGVGSSSLSNQCPLPDTNLPENVVAMLWDDLNFSTSGSAYYQTFDICPLGSGLCTVVEYYNVAHYGGSAGSAGTWETIFYEDGSLMIQFLDAGIEEGSGSTTGMEDANYAGDYGLTYACNTSTSIYNGLSVLFSIAPAPRLNESTKSAPSKIEIGNPIDYTITILNTGDVGAEDASLVDPIPLGTVYNGDVACSSGTCSYDPGTDTVYWNGQVTAPPKLNEWNAPITSSTQSFAINQPANASIDSSIAYNPIKPTSEILLDQEPNQSNGIFSDANCDICGGAQVLAENFALENTTRLEQVVMWGGFYTLDLPGEPDVIRVIIHQDAGGLPGTVVYDENNIGYSRVQTGVILFGVHEWQHTLTLASPAVLPAGNYWIEIYFTTGVGDNDDYFWEAGNPDTMGRGLFDSAYAFEAPGVTWIYPNGSEMAFQLIGEMLMNPVTVTFSVTPDGLSCGDTVVNNAVIDDPALIAPVNVSASTELVNTIYYAENFEANNGGYSSVGANPWTWGPPPAALAPAHSGVNVWATESPYVISADYQLVSPWIDLTNAIPNRDLVLQWWQKLDVEINYDFAYVDISTDGTNWTNVWIGNYHGIWENISVDITPFIGQVIELRFELTTDPSVVYNGWAIDDVTIHSGCQLFVDPNIVVTPLSLLAAQPPDTVTTQTLQICNAGFSPLDWSLTEVPSSKNLTNQPRVSLPTQASTSNTQSENVTPFEGVVTQVGTGLLGSAGSSGLGNPDAILYDNGPLITHPGGGYNGADASALQSALSLNTYGFGDQYPLGYRMADDFVVTDPAGWDIQQITFFAYQSFAPVSPSPIVGVYYQIWNGPPDDPNSSVVFGDLTTNRLVNSNFSNIYRALDTNLTNADRGILTDVASAGVTLPPGTYWLDWSTDGNASYSGPWAPPITILGQTTTGNAMQWTGAWAPALDTGTSTQQGMPFIIEGSVMSNPPDVLLLNADDDNDLGSPIQGMLQAFGDLGLVDLYNATNATPTLAELQAYDVVVTWSNIVYYDPVGIGNVLADYVDGGGKVINLMFSMGTHGWQMGGRFMDEGYTAMNGTSLFFSTICLGSFDPTDPIMAGITDVCEYYRMTGTYLTPGSHEVAQWADGLSFVAAKDDRTVVSINGYVGYSYLWTGQMDAVLHNAILWLAGAIQPSDIPWLSENPLSGTLDPSECTLVDARFDSAGLVPDTYTGVLDVNSNDPDTPIVPVGVTLNVFLAPDITVDPSFLESTLLPNTQETQNLTVCNVGQSDLNWDLSEIPGLKVNSVTTITNPAANSPRQVALTLGNLPGSGKSTSSPVAPEDAVTLLVDDGSGENNIGLNDGVNDYQFLWFNRFTPDPTEFPFNLEQIQVFFDTSTGVVVGDAIDLVVYQDADGDPSTGATWLATYNVTVQAVDGVTWSVYDLPSPLLITGPGDVLIGAVNRYTVSGVSPATFPAALDQTASELRSWVASYSADPPDPPTLPSDGLFGLIDDYFPGNWMVRGYGETISTDIPWVSETPTSGTVVAGDCVIINVTFDSTDLMPGTYSGSLDINSNDPDTPEVMVPLTLNVVVPDIVVTPDALELALFPNETDTLNFNIENTGGWNLDWSVTDGATWLSELPVSGTILPGDSKDVVATFDSTGLIPGIYHTNIDIASNDPDTPHFLLPVTLTVNPLESDLSVVKTANAEVVRVGDTITYTLLVSNAGDDDAVGVMLVDTLPTLVEFVSASAGCVEDAGVVTCDIGDLAANDDITLTIIVTAAEAGTATNTAVVSSDYVTDPIPGNNTDTAVTTIRPAFYYFYLPIIQKP